MRENIMKNRMIKLIIIFIASYQLHAVNFSEDISPIIYNNNQQNL